MGSLLLLGVSALLALAGCTLLALNQKQHVATVLGRGAQPPLGKATPATGWLLLALALIPSMLGDRPGFAVLYWLLAIFGSALTVVMLIAFKPGWLKNAVVPLVSKPEMKSRSVE